MVAVAGSRRVVRSSDCGVPAGVVRSERDKLDRLARVMEDWAEWMRHDDCKVGWPSHAAMIRGADTACVYERAEGTRVELVDAAVEDLSAIHRAAISRRYGVCAVWRFPRLNYAEILEGAHGALIANLRKRGIDINAD